MKRTSKKMVWAMLDTAKEFDIRIGAMTWNNGKGRMWYFMYGDTTSAHMTTRDAVHYLIGILRGYEQCLRAHVNSINKQVQGVSLNDDEDGSNVPAPGLLQGSRS